MVWIFEIKDASGRRIHLSKERWSHIQKHPEMTNKIEQIQETLQYPEIIVEFEYDSDVKFYYKYCKKKERIFIYFSKIFKWRGLYYNKFLYRCNKIENERKIKFIL